jgi:hypothetical protein
MGNAPSRGPYGPNQGPGTFPGQGAALATGDFLQNYRDMRNANTIGADKYFHCKANCEAARRGESGEAMACTSSDTREWFDQKVKGDPLSASLADQNANEYGRGWGANTNLPCDLACMPYRPNGLSPRY